MYLSREAGWYDVNGNALYVRKGERFADGHPAVKAVPSIFDQIGDDGPPPKAKVAQAVAAAVARGKPEAKAAEGKPESPQGKAARDG